MCKKKYQIYKSFEEFKESVISKDPMKEFEPVVRQINWEVQTKKCQECGEEFETDHPARIFCENCYDKIDKTNKGEAVIDRLQNKMVVRDCENCGRGFILSAPAMLFCEYCTERGGKLVR